jgi:hypothetical protein
LKQAWNQFYETLSPTNCPQQGDQQQSARFQSPREYLEKATTVVEGGFYIIYKDFAKAFGKVPKERLLSKGKAHGKGGQVLSWIRNRLTGRR